MYFVDCQNPDSEYVRGFEKVGVRLKNKVGDQKFDGAWGLVNDPGKYNKKEFLKAVTGQDLANPSYIALSFRPELIRQMPEYVNGGRKHVMRN